MDHERTRSLPNGRTLDVGRPRGDGVLDAEELAYCRENGVPVGFDPAQGGWLPLACEDDFGSLTMAAGVAPKVAAGAAPPSLDDLEAELRRTLNGLPVAEASTRAWALVDTLADRGRAGAKVQEVERVRAALQQVVAELGLVRRPTEPREPSRFALRPWEPADADVFLRILGNRNLWRYLPDPYPEPFTLDVARELIEISNAAAHHEVRAVTLDGEVIGQVRLSFEPYPGLKVAEVAYWLAESHWGKGLMSSLLHEYTDQALRAHGLDQIHAWIHPENVGSQKAAVRAGYRRDPWRHEAALAVAVRRTGCERYTAYGAAGAGVAAETGHARAAAGEAEPVG